MEQVGGVQSNCPIRWFEKVSWKHAKDQDMQMNGWDQFGVLSCQCSWRRSSSTTVATSCKSHRSCGSLFQRKGTFAPWEKAWPLQWDYSSLCQLFWQWSPMSDIWARRIQDAVVSAVARPRPSQGKSPLPPPCSALHHFPPALSCFQKPQPN